MLESENSIVLRRVNWSACLASLRQYDQSSYDQSRIEDTIYEISFALRNTGGSWDDRAEIELTEDQLMCLVDVVTSVRVDDEFIGAMGQQIGEMISGQLRGQDTS
jgi:hypothetical protein